MSGTIDINSDLNLLDASRVKNSLPPVDPGDLTNKGWVQTEVDVAISETAPASPRTGRLWWHPNQGLKIRYNDGSNSWWVDATPKMAGGSVGGSSQISREFLQSKRLVYVRTDGDDNNSGLSDTSVGAFKTIGRAFEYAASLDKSLFCCEIHVGPGTFAGSWIYDTDISRNDSYNIIVIGSGIDVTIISTPISIYFSEVSFSNMTIYSMYANSSAYLFVSNAKIMIEVASNFGSTLGVNGVILNGMVNVGPSGYAYVYDISVPAGDKSGNTFFSVDGGRLDIEAPITDGGATNCVKFISKFNGAINTIGVGDSIFPGDLPGILETGGVIG